MPQICDCDAYPFPHRKGGGACHEDLVCPHGVHYPEHPDYDSNYDRCEICARQERMDVEYAWRKNK